MPSPATLLPGGCVCLRNPRKLEQTHVLAIHSEHLCKTPPETVAAVAAEIASHGASIVENKPDKDPLLLEITHQTGVQLIVTALYTRSLRRRVGVIAERKRRSMKPGCIAMLSILKRHFSIFLTDGFSLLAFTSMTAPLRIANETLGYQAYTWDIVTEAGGDVQSSCRVSLPASRGVEAEREIQGLGQRRFLMVLLGNGQNVPASNLIRWVRESLSRGVSVGGIGRGAIYLAQFGLLDGRRCAVPWDFFEPCVESFPQVLVSRSYFEIDGLLYTCAGEAAVFDLILEIVKRDFGSDLSDSINERALQGKARNLTDRQALALHMRLERLQSPLLPIVQLMERTVSEPMTMHAIAATSGISRRQIERLFQQQLGMAPRKFYCHLRVERAHSLLENSGIPILDVALATGFTSHSHFTKVYRAVVGCTPQETRAGHRRDGTPCHRFYETRHATLLAL